MRREIQKQKNFKKELHFILAAFLLPFCAILALGLLCLGRELMKDGDSSAEFGRNELADIFSCVPSQINYVISTRFGPEKGYTVESRRGGGGYIKIKRINPDGRAEVIAGIKDACDEKTARAAVKYLYDMNLISGQSAKVLTAAVSDRTLAAAKENRDKIRADILKNAAAAL